MSKNDNLKKISAVNNMVDIIKEVVQDEINKQDNTVLCRVVKANDNGFFDVFVEPDEQNIITNIPSLMDFGLKQNDYVYVYKIRNQLNNSFIIKKLGDNSSSLSERVKELEDRLNSINFLEGTGNINPEILEEYLPLIAGSRNPLTGDLYIKKSAPSLILSNNGEGYIRKTSDVSGEYIAIGFTGQ